MHESIMFLFSLSLEEQANGDYIVYLDNTGGKYILTFQT